jgi:hypothetical protein
MKTTISLRKHLGMVWLPGIALGFLMLGVAYALTSGPSTHCHVTDGAFTACADGSEEWSDIAATTFPDAVLYVDQADLDPDRGIPGGTVDTLMLMYDEVSRTVPLGPGEAVHVHFMTVDELELLHYDVFIDGTGIQKVLINGVEQVPMPAGVAGIAGFGSSPNNPTPHAIAEFQIGLEAAGFTSEECCYSPDPAWWGSDVPPNPECPRDPQQPTTGDQQCPPQDPESTTAGIFTANPDGSTTVEPQPLLPPGEEPPLCESMGRIVDFRVPPTGTYKNHGDYMKKVAQLAEALVQSQVDAGLITEEEAEELQSCVVHPRARSNVGK